MIFSIEAEEETLYLFGGQSPKNHKRRTQQNLVPVFELNIEWQEGKPLGAKIARSRIIKDQGFHGSPSFSQNMPSKRFLEAANTWTFLDQDGTLHYLDLTSLKTGHQDIREIRKLN